MHQLFRGSFFNFEAIRILGMTRSEGADIAECFQAVGSIRENDPMSWQKAWSKQAEWAESLAQEAQCAGNKAAARGAFLRASNYTRASSYMMTGDQMGTSDSRVVPFLQKAAELFRSATKLLDSLVYPLQIPYDTKDGKLSLPAYLYCPRPSTRLQHKTPLLVNIAGADSTQEEQYFMFPAAGPELGYAVLTFEGPGQGLALHEHNIPMRPDWEEVIRVVLDYVSTFAGEHEELELDLTRIAIAGASLGGYFALRAAADERCKACIAIDPVYDLYEFGANHAAPTLFAWWNAGWIPNAVINSLISLGTRLSFQSRWEIFTSARFLGVSTPVDLLQTMKKFSLHRLDGAGEAKSYLDELACPVLVSGAAQSVYFDVDDHTSRVFKGIKHQEKEMWVGADAAQGGLQAKMGAVALCNQRVFSFLDRSFDVKRIKV
ncbi:Hydrolyase ccsE [Lachnellula arida]|uniref:Hydrolyase ccsE n=1 Tax=Lachnellula arida TaxID=1316785 RepID=A0A8T9BIS8_9HELO|nr:Hydrolyase ccsE [Lachnellula arida]